MIRQSFFFLCAIFYFLPAKPQTISKDDLQAITGIWTGQLTYLDYSSNKEVSIKASLDVTKKKSNTFLFHFDYPGEPGHGSREKYIIRENGRKLNNNFIIERSIQKDGTVRIIFEEKGKDGNEGKPAIFHHVLEFSPDKFTIIKLVKFESEEKFIQRNMYSFSR